MTTIKINGYDLQLDTLDADVMEQYERLNEDIQAKIADADTFAEMTGSQAMRKQCALVDEFIDGLFGEGVADAIFTSPSKLGERLEAFAAIANAVINSKHEIDAISQKYSFNREQRRAMEKMQRMTPGKVMKTQP